MFSFSAQSIRIVVTAVICTICLYQVDKELYKFFLDYPAPKVPHFFYRIPYLIGSSVLIFLLSGRSLKLRSVAINFLLGSFVGLVVVILSFVLGIQPKLNKDFYFIILIEVLIVFLAFFRDSTMGWLIKYKNKNVFFSDEE